SLDADLKGVRVSDNGRGIPIDLHPEHRRPALELILTTLHAGAKFGEGASYNYSGGLHGVGSSVVNALAESFEATVSRDGRRVRQCFVRGTPVGPMEELGAARGTGTSIHFRPDPEIFPEVIFDPDRVRRALEARSFLHHLHLTLVAEGQRQEFPGGGVADFLARLMEDEEALGPVFAWSQGEPRMEVALAWTRSPGEKVWSYANGIVTPQGGTHEAGFKIAVARALRSYFDTHGLTPKDLKLSSEDLRDGLRAVVSVFLHEPQFKGQTKERLNNPEVNGALAQLLTPWLEHQFHERPAAAGAIAERLVTAARTRAEWKAASEMGSKGAVSAPRLQLPGKLADCSSTRPAERELFLVEGDSAGGSAKQARDRRFQAVLPLRGKILNTEQARLTRLGESREIADLVSAMGCGIGPRFDVARLRYHRVVILTDADSDGHHIAALLLTLFYRHLPELIQRGHLYLGRPPLFRVSLGGKVHWAWDEEEKERLLSGGRRKKSQVTRFKGLGEMSPAQLRETTLDPASRTLFRVVVPDPAEADRALRDCFGRDPAPRYRLVMERSGEARELDV
ncbi:MAG: toprim domain-containing protein, partial [Candidatus Eremiobacterota bacterium]